MSHWSSRLPVCFQSQGTQVQIPWAVLMLNQDSPVSVVLLHWWPRRDWSSLWPRLRRALSQTVTRPSCRQCDNPTWSHTAFQSLFHGRCRSPFLPHNWRNRLLGGSPVESLQPCLTGPVDYLFASPHKGPRFKSPGGYLCKTGILLLALSRYMFIISPTFDWVWSHLVSEEKDGQHDTRDGSSGWPGALLEIYILQQVCRTQHFTMLFWDWGRQHIARIDSRRFCVSPVISTLGSLHSTVLCY
jgi:hypothetical protein